MKKALIAILILFVAEISFAGDAAAFKEIGFSPDGNFFVFAQYGKTDVKYQPYAEIYTVDVIKNKFVQGAVYKNLQKSNKSGRELFDELYSSHSSEIKKYNCVETVADDVIYVLESEYKKGTDGLDFKNLGDVVIDNGELNYEIRLVPSFFGNGVNCQSSFYIDLAVCSKSDSSDVKKYKVGSPDIKRKGVTDYKIVRILRDRKRCSLVFVVEKTVEDSTGTSIRYMVETVKL